VHLYTNNLGAERVVKKKPSTYAWFALAIMLVIRILQEQQMNVIGFAFGFQGVGDRAANPLFMLSEAYPAL